MALKSEVESRRAEKIGFPIGTRAVGVVMVGDCTGILDKDVYTLLRKLGL